MEAKNQNYMSRLASRILNVRVALALQMTLLVGGNLGSRSIRSNIRAAAGKYAGWVMLFAIAGTLSAVAAVAITEAFVSPTLLVLTVGEWELLAVVFYILAILLYIGEQTFKTRST